jgi:hypothetical protein
MPVTWPSMCAVFSGYFRSSTFTVLVSPDSMVNWMERPAYPSLPTLRLPSPE